MRLLRVFNRQKSRRVDTTCLRRIGRSLLEQCLGRADYELAVHLIDSEEMARINLAYLGHAGSTDVITFDHHDPQQDAGEKLHGEIFISVEDALCQAGEFHSTWQWEVVRYVAHGVLHLTGHDDRAPGPRRKMKREENRLVKELSGRFPSGRLGRETNVSTNK